MKYFKISTQDCFLIAFALLALAVWIYKLDLDRWWTVPLAGAVYFLTRPLFRPGDK